MPAEERLRRVRRRLGWAMAVRGVRRCRDFRCCRPSIDHGPWSSRRTSASRRCRPRACSTTICRGNGNVANGMTPRPRRDGLCGRKMCRRPELTTEPASAVASSGRWLGALSQFQHANQVSRRRQVKVKGEVYVEVSPFLTPTPLPEYRGEGPGKLRSTLYSGESAATVTIERPLDGTHV